MEGSQLLCHAEFAYQAGSLKCTALWVVFFVAYAVTVSLTKDISLHWNNSYDNLAVMVLKGSILK